MVFQSYALYPQMTVRGEPDASASRSRGMPKDEIARAREARGGDPADRAAARPQAGRSFRAASASASRSAGRWCATPTSSCSTSRCPTSTPSCAPSLRVEIKRLHQRLEEHHDLRHPRPDRGDDAGRPHRHHARRHHPAAGRRRTTIYNRPVNLFVAGFIGSPAMNFLRGATTDGGKAFRMSEIAVALEGYDGNRGRTPAARSSASGPSTSRSRSTKSPA